ncbi:unnamed protein product [Brassicogethes aeneus]|uniref:Cap-specific mRNA (nucleoside-2'-O-)-methyltransferase 2 n=1 Tax=Brassicogethes aeneus TaxID=1431903 RepID=A0A9P0FF32_BRAAE|nr:unnamed protein product [Brassicogethes aeneus]
MGKQDIKRLFNKTYRFSKNEDWVIPKVVFSCSKWTIPSLQLSKEELNETKGLLNGVNLEAWSNHTKSRDPSSFIIQRLKQNINPELLTQAWCKFYECISTFPVVPINAINQGNVNSLHICEAPGAFICSLNQYLKLNYPDVEFNWRANTLNPNYEGNSLLNMISDDRLIKFTLDNWLFGEDATGDIKIFKNYIDIITKVNELGKRSLVTADGSVDCMHDPGNQEKHVSHLHYCETITALSVLETGGSFILKIFTMFEDSTINLLYLLNCIFEDVAIHKPCSSKSGNSEVYVICTLFKGLDTIENIWQNLLFPYKSGTFGELSMFNLQDIPSSFLIQIHECSEYYKRLQMKTITDNIFYFNTKCPMAHKRHYLKVTVAQTYLNKFKLNKMSNDLKIVPHANALKSWRNFNDYYAYEKGFEKLDIKDLIQYDFDEIEIITGKPILAVKNSKFACKTTIDSFTKWNFKSKKENTLYFFCLESLRKTYTIFDINDFNIYDQNKFQKDFSSKLQVCDNTKEIMFINFPFFTHYLVGILYYLIKAFKCLYFNKNGILILKHVDFEKLLSIKESLKKINDVKIRDGTDIIHIIPPNVFDQNPNYFEFIWCFNNHIRFL